MDRSCDWGAIHPTIRKAVEKWSNTHQVQYSYCNGTFYVLNLMYVMTFELKFDQQDSAWFSEAH